MTRPLHGGNLVWAATLAACLPQEILDFSASINPLGPPATAIAAIVSHLSDLRAYPDPGYGELRQALSQFHQLPTDWILPGNGAAELLTWAGRDLASLEATGLICPAFGDYGRALRAFGASILPWGINLALLLPGLEPNRGGLAAAIDLERSLLQPLAVCQASRVGLLLNNPHNPTGQLFSRQSILECLERFALVVVDEAFMDFLPPSAQQSLLDQVQVHPNLVIVRSLTKFYSLPGLRIGYAIAHPERLQRWQGWRDPWPVNTLAIAATRAAVADFSFQHQTWDWLAPAREQLFQGLSQIPGLQPYPGAANFLLVGSEVSVTELQQQLLQQSRILIRDCLSFPELGDRYFRVAVRTPGENQQLLESLARILASAPQ